MDKKLTLNIDEEIVSFAHEYSKQTQQSISSIVEKYFSEIKQSNSKTQLPTKTSKLYGTLAQYDLPDKKTMREAFYGKSSH